MDATPLLKLTTALALLFAIIVSLFQSELKSLLSPPPIKGSCDQLHASRIFPLHSASGPESIAFDPSGGGPYTGVADGRILKWEGDAVGWVDFATTSPHRKDCTRPFAPEMEHICGRPLGLRFEKKTGDLYIADAYFGLQVVGPEGGLATRLVKEAEGEPLYFTNDMDIDEHEDVIYFTDSSTDFRRREFMDSVLSGDKTGRLLKYDKTSKQVTVLLRNLSFANGVSLSNDHSFVLVAETSTRRILRLWLRGPDTGKVDVFCELPGVPDNIRRNAKGEFWVALHAKDGLVPRLIVSHPWVGKLMLKLPMGFKQLHLLLVGASPYATILKLDEKGKMLEVLEDIEGRTVKFISEVEEKDGKLWMGSVMVPFIGIFDL